MRALRGNAITSNNTLGSDAHRSASSPTLQSRRAREDLRGHEALEEGRLAGSFVELGLCQPKEASELSITQGYGTVGRPNNNALRRRVNGDAEELLALGQYAAASGELLVDELLVRGRTDRERERDASMVNCF